MKRFTQLILVGAALMGLMASPSRANLLEPKHADEPRIMINGMEFEGLWAIIGERPYVAVSSLAKALGFPRVHDVKAWYLGEGQPKQMNPLEMVVYAPSGKLPTTRFGGATMVDLRSAADALDIPFHYDFGSRTYQLGNPYEGEWMVGAWYRFFSIKDYDTVWGQKSPFDQAGSYWPHSDSPESPAKRRVQYHPYPDDYRNEPRD